ncbi:MAG: hypothetical protein K1X55_14750 [Chitinophagales bacterium]|nr:hypothetical protein [Chitinophagales bacterium]
MKVVIRWFLIMVVLAGFFSCKKDKLITDGSAKLSFSVDTLTFDTVFVRLGSTTKLFTIRNEHKQPILISNIQLEGGENSKFRMNVDGAPVTNTSNIEIPANDSIYVFVEVTVDPTEDNLPFVIEDKVKFETNGNEQKVILRAWGQNAHFYDGVEIESEVWDDDLPYVVLNSMVVKEGHTLQINPGVTVFMGPNSGIFVNGNIVVFGGIDSVDRVVFRGLRLDEDLDGTPYDQIPGQWLGIFLLRGSTDNKIENAELRNGSYGLSLGSASIEDLPNISRANAPNLILKSTKIYNMAYFGIYAFLSDLTAENVLIHSTGLNSVAFQVGGAYTFKHCTFYNRGNAYLDHKDPVCYLSNFFEDEGNQLFLVADLEKADFINCIIDGSLDEELIFDPVKPELATAQFNYSFDHTLLKTKKDINTSGFTSIKKNEDPLFRDRNKYDFHIKVESPCRDFGSNLSIITDLDGNPRDGFPDLGAFEYIP